MQFEYDMNKSLSNLSKHGIDFEQAQMLWHDERLISVPVCSQPESRYLTIGKIGEKYWSAIFTLRAQKIRLISVRRARKQEIAFYEKH